MTLIESTIPPRRHHGGVKASGLPSLVVKRSLMIVRHKTSVSVEAVIWKQFKRIAVERKTKLNHLAAAIDARRTPNQNMSSAIRCFVVETLAADVAAATAVAICNPA